MARYNPTLTRLARTLRTDSTDSERLLWSRLRRKQVLGVQFFRQRPLGNYIVDFYAPTVRLVIEVDGSQHFLESQTEYELKRTTFLESHGLRVLRFTNLEVLQGLNMVMEEIWQVVDKQINQL